MGDLGFSRRWHPVLQWNFTHVSQENALSIFVVDQTTQPPIPQDGNYKLYVHRLQKWNGFNSDFLICDPENFLFWRSLSWLAGCRGELSTGRSVGPCVVSAEGGVSIGDVRTWQCLAVWPRSPVVRRCPPQPSSSLTNTLSGQAIIKIPAIRRAAETWYHTVADTGRPQYISWPFLPPHPNPS
jgi:hypothetical protein